jgi:hypothetical protein
MIKELWEKNKKAIVDASLELLRIIVLAVIPYVIDRVAGLNLPIEVIVSITVALRWLDKYLHKYGKENNIEELVKGITRF